MEETNKENEAAKAPAAGKRAGELVSAEEESSSYKPRRARVEPEMAEEGPVVDTPFVELPPEEIYEFPPEEPAQPLVEHPQSEEELAAELDSLTPPPEVLAAMNNEEKLALAQRLSEEVAKQDYSIPTFVDEKPKKRKRKEKKSKASKEPKRSLFSKRSKKNDAAEQEDVFTPVPSIESFPEENLVEPAGEDVVAEDALGTSETEDAAVKATHEIISDDPLVEDQTATTTDTVVDVAAVQASEEFVSEGNPNLSEIQQKVTVDTEVAEEVEEPFVETGESDLAVEWPEPVEHLSEADAEDEEPVDPYQVSSHVSLLQSGINSKMATSAILAEVRDRQLTGITEDKELGVHHEANEIPSRRKKKRNNISIEELAELRAKEEEELDNDPHLVFEEKDIIKYVMIAAAVCVLLALFAVWNIFSS